MKRCFNLIPPRFDDGRHEAIERGLARHGYQILRQAPHLPGPGDVLTAWNLHGDHVRAAAAEIKAAGGRVIVAEEGYCRRTWPVKHFAIALDGHNGAGRWHAGGPERWGRMGLALAPWRADDAGAPVYVTEQRGIGSPEMRSPPNWHETTIAALRHLTKRPVLLRRHFKLAPQQPPIEKLLAGAHALVTWGSSDAVRALIAGIPVFYCAPHNIVAFSAQRGISAIDDPLMNDDFRLHALRRMAWAQWRLEELSAGEPFEHLLAPEKELAAA